MKRTHVVTGAASGIMDAATTNRLAGPGETGPEMNEPQERSIPNVICEKRNEKMERRPDVLTDSRQ